MFISFLYTFRATVRPSSGETTYVVLPFFLMAYRATPHSTTGYSPFYLLHGREMVLPNEGDFYEILNLN